MLFDRFLSIVDACISHRDECQVVFKADIPCLAWAIVCDVTILLKSDASMSLRLLASASASSVDGHPTILSSLLGTVQTHVVLRPRLAPETDRRLPLCSG